MEKWRKQLQASLQTNSAKAWRAHANHEESDFRKNLKLMDGDFPKLQWDNIKWTDDVRMTKAQSAKTLELIWADAKVWSMVQHRATGACAVALKLGNQWILVFEDGEITHGKIPKFLGVWPALIKRPDFKPKDKTFIINDLGGVSFNRYA